MRRKQWKNLESHIPEFCLLAALRKMKRSRKLPPTFFAQTIHLPPTGEYVADGAAKQAAWALNESAQPPQWKLGEVKVIDPKHRVNEIVADYMELIQN